MKWYLLIGAGIVIALYAASRRVPAESSSSDQDDESTPFGIAVGEPHPSAPTKSTGGVLSDGGGIMAGYPRSGLWSGGDCNCGGGSS